MFWKRKKNNSEFFSCEADDRRASFRVCPSEDEPIVFKSGAKGVKVLDISAGGLSFENSDFVEGDSLVVEFALPGQNMTIAAMLEILSICGQNICHCRFEKIEETAVEEIHQYVLARQKEILNEEKKSKQRADITGFLKSEEEEK